MYFPYLRGKQNELFALGELANKINLKRQIIPIVEPVRKNMDQIVRLNKYYTAYSTPYILIVNPQVGELKNKGDQIEKKIASRELQPHNDSMLGFIISPQTKIKDVEAFLKRYSKQKKSIIHSHSFSDSQQLKNSFSKHSNIVHQIFIDGAVSESYQNVFSNYDRVLIKDGFKRAKKNADFPPDEFFSDLHLTYKKNGYAGFGDFTTIGQTFDVGGRAHAVAIHLTYHNDNGEIWIKHFISDRTATTLDIDGKFLEALEKLVDFINKNRKSSACDSCSQFRDLHRRKHFPQLGPIKKLSIKHHIELIGEVL
jgi:hypothetical protein